MAGSSVVRVAREKGLPFELLTPNAKTISAPRRHGTRTWTVACLPC